MDEGQVPTGQELAHGFMDRYSQRYTRGQGCEGIWEPWRTEEGYCYVWVESFVDHDYSQFFLLDIRTMQSGYPQGQEYRDYLCVGEQFGDVKYLWMNSPIPFSANHETHVERFISGMTWFAGCVEMMHVVWEEANRKNPDVDLDALRAKLGVLRKDGD